MSAQAQLEDARLALEHCAGRGRALAASIPDAHWAARPPSGGWAVAECLTHLNLTTAGLLPLLRAGAEEARSNAWPAASRFRVGLMGRLLCWVLEPPYRMKTATQPAFVPGTNLAKADVMRDWDAAHAALDALVRDGVGLALDRPKIVSPFDPRGRVRYSVFDALLIIGAHERRHLWQAEQAAKRLES